MAIRVFIADDQADIRMLLRLLFETDDETSFEIVGEAADPDDTIARVTELQPDAIVLDQSFNAERTGLEISPILREAAPAMKIVLFTAYEMAQEVRNAPAVDAYVLKTETTETVATVKRLLGA